MPGCSGCKAQFEEGSFERDNDNWPIFGFKSKEAMEKHNKTNKCCPVMYVQKPDKNADKAAWPSPKYSSDSYNEYVYLIYQEQLQQKSNIHNLLNAPKLWYENAECAATFCIQAIFYNNIYEILLVAEPGAGKTSVIHNLIYQIGMLPYEQSISYSRITITTGMSDCDWYDQLLTSLQVNTISGKTYFMEEIHNIDNNYCITHRSNFYKRINFLLNNLQLLTDHIFIIDESHIADEDGLTIDLEMNKLGITKERLIEYNIKIINVSATPDVQLSYNNRNDHGIQIKLKNGSNYKGFTFYNTNNYILNYPTKIEDLTRTIRHNYSSPRYHFIRVSVMVGKGQYRNQLITTIRNNNWDLIEDDSDHNYTISGTDDKISYSNNYINLFVEPKKHTFILLKAKYTASKRLKLTKYVGIIAEKPAIKTNTTVTCNGLIPRFFGYDDIPLWNNNEPVIFLCDIQAVNEYIELVSETQWTYNNKNYTGKKIIANKEGFKELASTWLSDITDQTQIKDSSKNIPIKLTFTPDSQDIREKIITCRKNKDKVYDLLNKGINDRSIIVEDKNDKQFDINENLNVGTIRIYTKDHKSDGWRFEAFNANFNASVVYSQGTPKSTFSLDMVKDRYDFNGFINEKNTAWITYRN